MEQKELIATGIALQTQVLKSCPDHGELYFDDEENVGRAFSLAVELVRHHTDCVGVFGDDSHALTDLLSDILGRAPACCPQCSEDFRHSIKAGPRLGHSSVLSIGARASH